MTVIRRADPIARRHALIFTAVTALVGGLLLITFQHYRPFLYDWVTGAPPEESEARIKAVFRTLAMLTSAPLVIFAAYLWQFGARIGRAQEFPPPGYRVMRDTPVVAGPAAVTRARLFKLLAAVLAAAAIALCLIIWRLGTLLVPRLLIV